MGSLPAVETVILSITVKFPTLSTRPSTQYVLNKYLSNERKNALSKI